MKPSSNRITETVRRCNSAGHGALMPFIVIGDPNLETSLAAVDAIVAGGADLLEFGFPFSDPPADGPTVQAADVRALSAGVTPDLCFEFLREVKRRHDVPVALLMYFNLILQRGLGSFFQEAAACGVDAILVADVPLEEMAPLKAAALGTDVGVVCIASALTTPERLQRLSGLGEAYLYVVSRIGVTGEQRQLDPGLPALLSTLREAQRLPALVGFGISGPAQVAQAMNAGADGVICGSAVIRRMSEHSHDHVEMRQRLERFVRSMKEATLHSWRAPN